MQNCWKWAWVLILVFKGQFWSISHELRCANKPKCQTLPSRQVQLCCCDLFYDTSNNSLLLRKISHARQKIFVVNFQFWLYITIAMIMMRLSYKQLYCKAQHHFSNRHILEFIVLVLCTQNIIKGSGKVVNHHHPKLLSILKALLSQCIKICTFDCDKWLLIIHLV